MQHRRIGGAGIKVSTYCLGAMMFGNSDPDECFLMPHKALDFGINIVDIADEYSQGDSEIVVGMALKGRRDNVVLATKALLPVGDDWKRRGSSQRWLTRAVEDLLRRLQTDCIDLYQVHGPAPDIDIQEPLSVLADLMLEGKTREICAPTFPTSNIVEVQWFAEQRES